MSDRAITNSTCLIGLERIGRLDILPQVFPVVFAPQAVQAEIGITPSWVRVQGVQNTAVVATLQTKMHVGEAEAIALALELKDVVVILDDRKARLVAEQLGLQVIGTAGMLVRAKQKGVIAVVKPLLTALKQADFRISEAIVQKALQIAGEL